MNSLKEKIHTANGETLYDIVDLNIKAKQYAKRVRKSLKPWDVYWAAIRFEDDPKYWKIRPVIIISYDGKDEVSTLYCSSKNKPGRYCLVDYLNVGLSKPTYVPYNDNYDIPVKWVFEKFNKPISKKDQIELSKLIFFNETSEKLISEKETVSMRRLKEDDTIRIGNREYHNSVIDNGEVMGKKIDLGKENARIAKENARIKGQKVLDEIRSIEEYEDDPMLVMFHELVPDVGKADTVAGEVVRAMHHILYRFENDGDLFYTQGGFDSNVAQAAAYVGEKTDTLDMFTRIVEESLEDEDYIDAVNDDILPEVEDYLEKHPEMFAESNEESYADYDASVFDQDDTYVFEMGSDVADRIDSGVMNNDDVYNFIDDFCMSYIGRYPKKIYKVMDGCEIECTTRERDILDQHFWNEYESWLEDYPLEEEDDGYDDEEIEESIRHRATFKNGTWEEMNVLH